MQDHRKLRVWRKAHALVLAVRRATRHFRRSGYGPLQSQMTSAAESILFNLVEECGASTPREFARFIDMAIKSSKELEAESELAKDYGVLTQRTWSELSTETVDARRMLCGLRKRVLEGAR
jgi:four helix bundle protein